jgi:hypothetical protein
MKRSLMISTVALLALLIPTFVSAQDLTKTFMVQNGAAPWFDRVGVWSLDNLPTKLEGMGPLPQQECTSRAINVPGTPTSILLGVSEGDLAAFKTQFPAAYETGDAFAIKNATGTAMPYKALLFPNPPAIIKGGFNAGLILLKIDPANLTNSTGSTGAPINASPSPLQKQQSSAFDTGSKEKLHLYLLIGQSNMVGRDTRGLENQYTDSNIGCLDGSDHWVLAKEPLPPNGTGVGPGTSFAREMLKKDPSVKIGLIACPVGGSPLSRWVKGGDLYERAVKQAKIAMEQGELKGVLWHQGESDCNQQEQASTYESRLTGMMRDLRQDLGKADLPIVVGELGEFLQPTKGYPFAELIRSTQQKMPSLVPKVAFISSKGLVDKGDNLHFSSDSEMEFGRRYALAMIQLESGTTPQ